MRSDSGAATDNPQASNQTAQQAAPQGVRGKAKTGSPRMKREISEDNKARVQELSDRVYSQTDISKYSLRDRIIIRAAGVFFYLLIRVICSSLQWEVRGGEHLDSIV